MKIWKRSLISTMIVVIISTLTNISGITLLAHPNISAISEKSTNIAMIISNFDNPFFVLTKKKLEAIQNENKNKVNFIFYDAKNNAAVQNQQIHSAIESNINLLVINLINIREDFIKDILNKAKQKNIPIILLGIPSELASKVSKIYNNAAFIDPNSEQAGIAEGKILVDLWNKNQKSIDKNNDNILNYVLIKSEAGNIVTDERTKGAISTIVNSGINAQELEDFNANSSEDLARSFIENLFLKHDNRIEAIISNNDIMAIGAVKALQKYGYNKGDKFKYIPVVGIDGIDEAISLIDKGFMTGTIIIDPKIFADQIFLVGMNLINNKSPIENTNYEFKDGEIIANFQLEIYTGKNNLT